MTASIDAHPLRLAAAAPPPADDTDDVDAASADRELQAVRPDQHELALSWAHWARTRHYYAKPSLPPSLLGRLQARGSVRRSKDGPDAIAGAELVAFHLAYLAQPADALDRKAFALHYLHRVRNIKTAAAELGVSRSHWYRLVAECRDRIFQAHLRIRDDNLAARERLQHAATAQHAAET
jgi:hypothetical protein